jgi:hypothetical protein
MTPLRDCVRENRAVDGGAVNTLTGEIFVVKILLSAAVAVSAENV